MQVLDEWFQLYKSDENVGNELSDAVINAAQHLLKQSVTIINGFQSSTLGQVLPYKKILRRFYKSYQVLPSKTCRDLARIIQELSSLITKLAEILRLVMTSQFGTEIVRLSWFDKSYQDLLSNSFQELSKSYQEFGTGLILIMVCQESILSYIKLQALQFTVYKLQSRHF